MSKKIALLALITLFIFACTLPSNETEKNNPNVVFTAAAETVSAQLTQASLNNLKTQTPIAPPPQGAASFTPLPPTSTAQSENNCDKAKFITDLSILDGTVFAPDESFIKTWRIKNIGTCTWTTSYALVFDNGEKMSGVSPQMLTENVAPGEFLDISVNLTAPPAEGTYTGNWQISNASNLLFAKVYVQIKVLAGDFAVTSVSDVDSFYISGRGAALGAKITVNQAGKVKYHWILREVGQPNLTTVVEEMEFAAIGTEEISTLWTACPHAGDFTAYLYIDDPNHQEFGNTTFSCP